MQKHIGNLLILQRLPTHARAPASRRYRIGNLASRWVIWDGDGFRLGKRVSELIHLIHLAELIHRNLPRRRNPSNPSNPSKLPPRQSYECLTPACVHVS